MGDFLDGVARQITAFWQHGQHFLWGCAGACALVFAFLYLGARLGYPDVASALSAYGLASLIAAIVLSALAIARTWEGRPQKVIYFVSNEEQSLWGHSRQPSGQLLTHISFRVAAVNVSDGPIHVSKPRIVWPLRGRWTEHTTAVLMTQNNLTSHSGQDFAVGAHERTHLTGTIMLGRKLWRAGKPLTFVVSVTDHTGKRHRIRFKHVRASNSKPA